MLLALLTAAQLLPGVAVPLAVPPLPAPVCGPALAVPQVDRPLPAGVSGRVRFYAARYDPRSGQVVRAVALGPVNEVQPLASTFKPLVVRGVLQDVDAGRLTLGTRYATTAANRSIEAYPPGVNTVRTLIRRAIYNSDNTAADILHLAYGPERLAREVRAASACTAVLLPTKAWWTAQAGLAQNVLGTDTAAGARVYLRLPFEARLREAAALIRAAAQVTAPVLEDALDRYFHGPTASPDLELDLQNTSTVKAFADLSRQTLGGEGLRPATRAVFREVMATGCCRPQPMNGKLHATYWAAKAGSGWRILNLIGSVETPQGPLAYAYFNDRSRTTDSEDMERQIGPVVDWIEASLETLTR